MNTCLVDPQEAAPCLDQGKPAQEHAPLPGHQRSRTPAAALVEEQNQTSLRRIGDRSWVMRAYARLWLALAIAVSLFAAPLRAQFAYVANEFSGDVSGYTIDPSTGALTPVAGSPFTAGAFPVSVAVDPSGKFAYVANGGSSFVSGNVSAYTIDPSTGALTAIAGSPFPAGEDPHSVVVHPSGKFAYVANVGSGNVSGYTIDPSTGALTAIAGSPFPAGPFPFGAFPVSVAVDPSGKFAYVANAFNFVTGYTIDPSTGALTAIAGQPFPAGASPNSVAVDPSGKFVYVASGGDMFSLGYVPGYTIDPGTGALTPIVGSPFAIGSWPVSVAVDPSGKFAYVANAFGNVLGYTIDPSTGALTATAGSPFPAGAGPESVAVDPSGKFAYVANGFGNVSGYTINPGTGALTAIAGSPFRAGALPVSVAITPLVPFSSSFAKLEITAEGFDVKESFTLARNSNGINPVTENVTLKIGTFSVTIPPGSFKQIPHGRFAFEGVINGVSLEVQIVPLGNNIFTFKAEGTDVDLTGLTNPVTVVLTIGLDSGTTTATAEFQ
jgi:DNA-binding beta-propeller fold protein YncE